VAVNRSGDRTEEIARASGAVVVRDEGKSLAAIRNAAARASRGAILVTIDADSRMTPGMLAEADRRLRTGRWIGGGSVILPERMSLGIAVTGLVLLLWTFPRNIHAGLFWVRREDFEAIGGFDETLTSAEDIDFAKRLAAHGRTRGKRFGLIAREHIVTSCRKFDAFGDWHAFREWRAALRLLGGRSPDDANRYWYDLKR